MNKKEIIIIKRGEREKTRISLRTEKRYVIKTTAKMPKISQTLKKFIITNPNEESRRTERKNILFFLPFNSSKRINDSSATNPKKTPRSFHVPTKLAVRAWRILNGIIDMFKIVRKN